jgi:transposase
MAIWPDLVDGHGFAEKYASVKRFVRKLRGSSTPEARVVIETAPGEEAQVDYGPAQWCATRKLASTGAHDCSS